MKKNNNKKKNECLKTILLRACVCIVYNILYYTFDRCARGGRIRCSGAPRIVRVYTTYYIIYTIHRSSDAAVLLTRRQAFISHRIKAFIMDLSEQIKNLLQRRRRSSLSVLIIYRARSFFFSFLISDKRFFFFNDTHMQVYYKYTYTLAWIYRCIPTPFNVQCVQVDFIIDTLEERGRGCEAGEPVGPILIMFVS